MVDLIASVWDETQFTPFLHSVFTRWTACENDVAHEWGLGPQALVYDAIAMNERVRAIRMTMNSFTSSR